MSVPNRSYSSTSYRYGFQGQEKDDEIKGNGNSLNYTFRMHDPRVGRFFAVDPLAKSYPHYTPYSFSGNKVIRFVELEGLEEFTNLSLAEKNKGYNLILVIPKERDDVIEKDFQMATKAGIPTMELENYEEFENGLKQMQDSNITVNVVVLTSHGGAASTYLGKDVLTNENLSFLNEDGTEKSALYAKDLPDLSDLVKAKTLVILSCSSAKTTTKDGVTRDGELLLTDISKKTNVTTFGAFHTIDAGIKFNGKKTFNNGGVYTWNGMLPEFNKDKDFNLYLKVTPKGEKSVVKDLTIDSNNETPVNYIKPNKDTPKKDPIADSPRGE